MKAIRLLSFLPIIIFSLSLQAQVSTGIKSFLSSPEMKGASFAISITDVASGHQLYSYDNERLLIPASVLKVVTTATAIELLGADYRYPTTIEYDGTITNGVLKGNLYIRGSGDPSLGSLHIGVAKEEFLDKWIAAIKKKGIKRIEGQIISDESIFDTEGVSNKWIYEDLGNYYGAGSYGVSVFDNLYRLSFRTGSVGSVPEIIGIVPDMKIQFNNYLKATSASRDSAWISGAPFVWERFLYGSMPANQSKYEIKGDIPDPPLFLARYLKMKLTLQNITTTEGASSSRIEKEAKRWKNTPRTTIITTYSPPLIDLIKICNYKSHNLYADAMLKTIGLQYTPKPNEVISSFARGVKVMERFWAKKGLTVSELKVLDGSGLSPLDKVTCGFFSELLRYMAIHSTNNEKFRATFPLCGLEGSVKSIFNNTSLQGKARMKSGGMSGVRSFVGYITKDDKTYAVAVIANNYNCSMVVMTKKIEKLILQLL